MSLPSVASPEVSVVVITHNRAPRLAKLLDTLDAQTLDRSRFEVIFVDDASEDDTSALLVGRERVGQPPLRTIRRSGAPNRAAARNEGWRAARAPLVAHIDDDCEADPDWLKEALEACSLQPDAIVQGRVDPIPAEVSSRSPATRTQQIHRAGPYYQTCNIFYPRELISRLGGFDAEAFTSHGGEDTDLAWRAISRGTSTAFAEHARAYHAVNRIGLLGRLQFASHWAESMAVYKRYPELRDAVFETDLLEAVALCPVPRPRGPAVAAATALRPSLPGDSVPAQHRAALPQRRWQRRICAVLSRGRRDRGRSHGSRLGAPPDARALIRPTNRRSTEPASPSRARRCNVQ